MNPKRTSLAIVGAAVIGFGITAVPAAAHDKSGERSTKAGAAAKGKAIRGQRGVRRLASCTIADDKVLTPETHAGLAKLKERLAERVADEKITQERADKVLAKKSKRVTIKVAMKTARWAPVFDLLGATGDTFKAQKMALREARKEAGGMKALLEAKGKTVADLRAARKEGRTAARDARVELCSSGAAAEPATT